MPPNTRWDPDYETGHALLDTQHRGLLAQCQALAEATADAPGFEAAFATLRRLAAEHFAAELDLLARLDYPALEDHRFACEEFDYLCDEVGTAHHFDPGERERFLTLWFVGHIAGSAEPLRAFLATRPAAG